jgi:hypothetical protein
MPSTSHPTPRGSTASSSPNLLGDGIPTSTFRPPLVTAAPDFPAVWAIKNTRLQHHQMTGVPANPGLPQFRLSSGETIRLAAFDIPVALAKSLLNKG